MKKSFTRRSSLFSPSPNTLPALASSRLRLLLGGVMLLLCWMGTVTPLRAQNATGSITGAVTDPSGAVIANAAVSVTNKATGAVRRLVTSSEGIYLTDNLPPGEYEVKIEAAGFASQVQALTVQVGITNTGNFSLTVGVASQTIEVAGGSAPILNTSDSSLGGIVTQRQIESLPLNGRSFLSVAGLEPGVTVTYQATSGVLNQNDFFQVGIGGAPSYMTSISVDGSRANDRITGGTSQNFSAETVQEFQIGTIGFDLSSGTASSGVVNIVSRSGGNAYHGSAFMFFRDHNISAFPSLTRPCLTASVLCSDPASRKRLFDPYFARKQYGATVSGPVKKNKLFFFANYERSDQVGAQPINFTDPLLAGFNHIGKVPFDQHLIGMRLDYRLSEKHSLFVRGNIDKNDSVAGAGLESTWIASSNFSYQAQLGVTSVLSSKVVNDFRFAYSYYRNRLFAPSKEICEGLAGDPNYCFGVGGTLINFFGGLSVGNNANTPQDRHPRTYQFTDNVSWTKGAHRLRFGGNWEHVYSKGSWFRNYAGTFSTAAPTTLQQTYRALYDVLPASLKQGYIGRPATFAELLQLPVSGQLTIGIGDGGQPVKYLYDKLTTNDHIRFYMQDSWQIKPKFTLNYGLAWSFEDNLVYHLLDRPKYLAPTGIQLGKIPQDYNNFDPALGFAWSVNSKTVVRGSVSLHHASGQRTYLKLQDQILIGPAGSGLSSASSSNVPNPKFGQLNPLGGFTQPGNLNFGTPVDFRAQELLNYLGTIRSVLGSTAYSGTDLSIRNIEVRKSAPTAGTEGLFDANYRTPYTIHINGGVQRQLRHNLSVSADFVMRRGVKFGANDGMYEDINRWNRYAANYTINATGQVVEGVNRFRNPVIPACATVLNASTPAATDPRLPSAQCSNNVIAYNQGGILSRYTALQVKVDKRFEHGFMLTGAYALARYTTFTGFNSFTDSSQNFGLSGASPKHSGSFSGIWELPKLKGGNKLLRGALNGWQASTIWQMSSRSIGTVTLGTFDRELDGTFTFVLPGASFGSFGRSQNPDDIRKLVDAYNATFPASKDTPLVQIGRSNRDAIGTAYPFIVLPKDRNFLSGDSFLSHDLRVTRVISIREKIKLNLIAEGFNLLNIANLTGYSNSLASAAYVRPTAVGGTGSDPVPINNNFGRETARVSPIFGTGGPRAFQFAARLSF